MHKRLNYANVTATLALFFAMSGGALAAKHYLINSTKQFNPKVLKALKGNAGAKGATGATGPNGSGKEGPLGKEGPPGKEGKEGARGPSDVYEVALSATAAASTGESKTLTLSGLPAGAYAIYGKAGIGPSETKSSSSQCELVAGTDRDKAFRPVRTDATWIFSIDTQLTHTFASTGSISMRCEVFSDAWFFEETPETRIIAIRVNTQTKTTAAAT